MLQFKRWAGSVAAGALIFGVVAWTPAFSAQPTEGDARLDALVSSIADVKAQQQQASAEKVQGAEREAIERDIRDVVAQESMAKSTSSIVTLTSVQIIIGILGMLGLAATLHYTRRSATFAQEAAKASVDSVELAEGTSHRQLRAYVNLKWVRIDEFAVGSPVKITFRIHNTGQTPALKCRSACDIQYVDVGGTPGRRALDYDQCAPGTIGAGIEMDSQEPDGAIVTQQVFDAVNAQQRRITIHIQVKYLDVFDVEHIDDIYTQAKKLPNGLWDVTGIHPY